MCKVSRKNKTGKMCFLNFNLNSQKNAKTDFVLSFSKC